MSPQTLRSLASAAVVGGLCWIALAAMNVAMGTSDAERAVVGHAGHVLFAVFAAALVLRSPGSWLCTPTRERPTAGSGALGATAGVTAQAVVIMVILIQGGDGPWFDWAAPPLAVLT